MASLNQIHVRRCPECNQIHDCAWFVEMQVLCNRLDKKMNELVGYVNQLEEEAHCRNTPELEDK
tara:strand:+ start:180 stop:371 length:192 start_codon:yes stop_codon:yes gene_type:complete